MSAYTPSFLTVDISAIPLLERVRIPIHDEHGQEIDPYPVDEAKVKQDKAKSAERQRFVCGSPRIRWDPLTGRKQFKGLWYCGRADCLTCQARRGQAFRRRIDAVYKTGPVYIQEVDDATAKRIMMEQGKEHVLRLPKGGVNVVFTTTEQYGGRAMTWGEINYGLDWTDLARLDARRNASGLLGKQDTSLPRDEQAVPVLVPEVGVRAEKQVVDQAAEVAVQETSYLNPKTKEELVRALRTRNNSFLRALCKLGVDSKNYLVKYVVEWVRLGDLKWQISDEERATLIANTT